MSLHKDYLMQDIIVLILDAVECTTYIPISCMITRQLKGYNSTLQVLNKDLFTEPKKLKNNLLVIITKKGGGCKKGSGRGQETSFFFTRAYHTILRHVLHFDISPS